LSIVYALRGSVRHSPSDFTNQDLTLILEETFGLEMELRGSGIVAIDN
jgi:hypothetical protein